MAYTMTDSVKAFLSRSNGVFIDGRARPGSADEPLIDINPSTGQAIAEFLPGDTADVDEAVTNCHHAFDDGRWRLKPPAEKARILQRIAELIDKHADQLAELEMLEAGKSLRAAREGEVPFAAECFRYHAGWCTKLEGSTKQMSLAPAGEFHAYTVREPIGVVGLIVPFNGPLVQTSWKLAPALAAGCCAVIKPDEKTSLSTMRLAELLIEAGIPPGVVNIVCGTGPEVGSAIVSHPVVAKVSFTGSTTTGREIGRVALEDMKKVTLELGGKSPVIVLADADLNKTIPGAADAIFSNAGQVCVAGSRLYVEEAVYDQVLEGVVEYANRLKVGPAHEPETEMGPLISEVHLNNVLRAVQTGVSEGATLRAGGERIESGGGYFMAPTVLSDVTQSMTVVQEEIFGPVLVATTSKDMRECLHCANDNKYGLAASIWTENVGKAHKMAAAIRAGLVWINCHGIPDMAVPFGGYKQSGWGRENGLEGLLAYTELKSVVCRLQK
ncbi:MAG: aldehyde dehydrogenase family protein [Gammaproteobacteria bacterium]|nr:aldehyde dehydrogenase family protein [Gammaproteobacteria bacterium]